MEQPPSCSTWSRVITNDHSSFIIASRSLSNTFQPIESERHYCEPEEDSMSECERGGLAPLRSATSQSSLCVRGGLHTDDSSFITSAISHGDIADLYNVPLDSDIYTLPVDTIPRNLPPRFTHLHRVKRKRRETIGCDGVNVKEKKKGGGSEVEGAAEPVHMTLQEVRQFLHNLYSTTAEQPSKDKHNHRSSLPHLLKKALCSVFRLRVGSKRLGERRPVSGLVEPNKVIVLEAPRSLAARALPPLPATPPPVPTLSSHPPPPAHFADSLHRVKDCGWYWGPVSGEAAERILSNEPDGSFIVRDSSDDHYIFSLTFRLNGCIRHVRIEHDHGNFSFGSATKFKSQTIVDFIETAVEHSRSGRYLFFLHRRPVLGPMRVQLLHPVSRFKHIQSLQHLCRFVIVKTVRRDLLSELPLPRRLIDYLNSPHYYSEQLGDQADATQRLSPVHLVSFAPPPLPPIH